MATNVDQRSRIGVEESFGGEQVQERAKGEDLRGERGRM